MLPPMRPLERVAHASALAFRFWDAADDRAITSGLVVEARPAPGGWPVCRAIVTPSGLFAFSRLPGFLGAEFGADFGEGPTSWWIEVWDPKGRYLPVAFTADPSRPDPGMSVGPRLAGSPPPGSPAASTWPGSPPPSDPGVFYLFSAPTRPRDPALAFVRGQLQHLTTSPVSTAFGAHAVVSIDVARRRWYSLADDQGRFLVAFPWPGFAPVVGSPVIRTPLAAQAWPATLRVFDEPSARVVPPGATLPDLRSIVRQGRADIYVRAPERGTSIAATLRDDLTYPTELVFKTAGDRDEVLIVPRP